MKKSFLAGVYTLTAALAASGSESPESVAARAEFVENFCSTCHNDALEVGNFSLEQVDLAQPARHAEALEKVVLKLRSGMMPPEGMPRPDASELHRFITDIETGIDDAASVHPNPGRPILHRLNRTEYANAIRDLLALSIDTEKLLPPDDMSQGYDNMSDVLTVSPTLLESYIQAAGKISRLAVGDPGATPIVETYPIPLKVSQLHHVEGTPFGTRGGLAVTHNFPTDGDYVIRLSLYFRSLGPLFGDNKPAEGEQLEVALNGERIAIFNIDRKMKVSEIFKTKPTPVEAGPQTISASFIQRAEGPVQDFVMPFDQSTADLTTGNVQGLTGLPHLRNIGIDGPYDVTGVSETPSRDKIFTCRPAGTTAADELACAQEILMGLARRAFRRPVASEDIANIMTLFASGRDGADFDAGIRTALQAILADPEFIFRFERTPDDVAPGANYPVSELELASRLSFFLWSSGPDDELITVASEGKLRLPEVLEAQTLRLLQDRRASTLATSFASHWLHLQNLEEIQPDIFLYPDWDYNLTKSMRQETLLFFHSIVREDRSILDLLTADYTFVDQRLAHHYEVSSALGNRFRRVAVEDETRRGLLGHASILTLTSLSNRTSPVIRGAWIMAVLLGTPPPKPPANVPPLKENEHGGHVLSVRERLEAHRKNPACAACHNIMDPIGYSLENFDPVGAWRTKDSGFDIDPSGTYFDGTVVAGPADLRKFLLERETLFRRNFTRHLLMYAMGRVIQHYDMPAVRAVAKEANAHGDRFSSYVLGIVRSTPFQMRRMVEPRAATDAAEFQQ